MHAHRFLGAAIVAAALLAPVAASAAATPAAAPETTSQKRVYDRSHKDYHVWDNNEDQAYRSYLGDQHIKYRSYSTLSRKRQTTYWNYRHTQGQK
jgi:hypothetical protein